MKHQLKSLLAVALLALVPTLASAQWEQKDADTKYATELVKAGTTAPDFKMKTLEGKNFKLSSLKGQWVVLDFWASWCPDCRKDAPEVARMAKEFGPKGVKFVGVSMDIDRDKWAAAVKQYGLDYTHVSELKKFKETDIHKLYGVNWIPSMVVINPQGQVALSTVLSYKVEKLLTETFAANLPAVGTDEQVTIDGAKGKLKGLLRRVPEVKGQKTPVAVLMHGFGGSKEGQMFDLIVDSLARHGIASVRFDFNGHGQSEGDFQDMTVPNEIEDAHKIVSYVRSLPWAGKIALLGHSQGGVVASMTAGELGTTAVSAVVLMAPAAVLRDDAIRGNTMGKQYDPLDPPEYVELWGGKKLGRKYIRTAFTLPIYPTAAKYQGPALIIHGTGDQVVPYTYGERYHDVWPTSRVEILDAYDHGFSQNVYRASRLASDFLIEVLAK